MYLKTYSKFTFCIKSQRHVSDENFILLYTPSWHNFFPQCLKYIRQNIHFHLLLKFSILFDMYLKTYIDVFNHIFGMVTPRALRQLFLSIALNCLTSPTFIANLCSHLIPEHYKTSTTCSSKHTF